jgi:hypothetical protein
MMAAAHRGWVSLLYRKAGARESHSMRFLLKNLVVATATSLRAAVSAQAAEPRPSVILVRAQSRR